MLGPREALTMVGGVFCKCCIWADGRPRPGRFAYRGLTHDRSSVSTSYVDTNLNTEQHHAGPAIEPKGPLPSDDREQAVRLTPAHASRGLRAILPRLNRDEADALLRYPLRQFRSELPDTEGVGVENLSLPRPT